MPGKTKNQRQEGRENWRGRPGVLVDMVASRNFAIGDPELPLREDMELGILYP